VIFFIFSLSTIQPIATTSPLTNSEYKPECTDKKLGSDLDQKIIMLIGQ
jgi:hypothetical protein